MVKRTKAQCNQCMAGQVEGCPNLAPLASENMTLPKGLKANPQASSLFLIEFMRKWK